MKTMFIKCMKKAGALVKPKDMTMYSYNPILTGECHLRNILRTDPQLKITQTQINLREYPSTSKQIKEILNTGQWMLVLDGNCIQLPIIDTHSLRAILLIY